MQEGQPIADRYVCIARSCITMKMGTVPVSHGLNGPAHDRVPDDDGLDASASSAMDATAESHDDVIAPPRKMVKPLRQNDESKHKGGPLPPPWLGLAVAGAAALVFTASQWSKMQESRASGRKRTKLKPSLVFLRRLDTTSSESGILAGRTFAVSEGYADCPLEVLKSSAQC